MITLFNNRRKYFQPVVKDITGVWAPFDMAKSSHVASAQLTDSDAAANPGAVICSSMKPLPDGSLLIGASKNQAVYVWKFAKQHSFEVSRFNAYYHSRLNSLLYTNGFFNDDGTAYYGGYSTGFVAQRWPITSEPYTFTKTGTAVEFLERSALLVKPQLCWITPDGKSMFYKENETWGGSIYKVDFGKPWPSNSYHGNSSSSSDVYLGDCYPWNVSSFTFRDFNEKVGGVSMTYWNGFAFSPDGLAMVATTHSGSGTTANDYAVKFTLSTAFDLSTLEFDSCRRLNDDFATDGKDYATAIAVNDAGTKMIIFNGNSTSTENKFHEYDLTA